MKITLKYFLTFGLALAVPSAGRAKTYPIKDAAKLVHRSPGYFKVDPEQCWESDLRRTGGGFEFCHWDDCLVFTEGDLKAFGYVLVQPQGEPKRIKEQWALVPLDKIEPGMSLEQIVAQRLVSTRDVMRALDTIAHAVADPYIKAQENAELLRVQKAKSDELGRVLAAKGLPAVADVSGAPSSSGNGDFSLVRLRGPSGVDDGEIGIIFSGGMKTPVTGGLRHGLKGGDGVYGGVSFEQPLNGAGSSFVAGFDNFHSESKPRYDEKKGRLSYRELEGALSVGARQKLFRVGVLGGRGERGLFVEPHAGVGANVLGADTEFIPDPEKPGQWTSRGGDGQRYAPMGYVSAGVNLNFGNAVAVGVEGRRYWNLTQLERTADFVGGAVTLMPGLWK